MRTRPASIADLERAVETITLAFRSDPVWSVALRRPDGGDEHHAGYWRFFLADALDQDGVWLANDGAAVAVWISPGGEELRPASVAALDAYNQATLGDAGAAQISELYDRFEASHPRTDRHAYLSLLATHPDHRGGGIGQQLLAENLRRWDALGVPTYLESTNPGNDHRYRRAGFRPVGTFRAVRDSASITTMWRPVGGAGETD